jgi:HNH endonuclease
VWCGRASWQADLTVEHLLPKTRGGRGLPENLVVACRRCNRRRGARPVVAYVRDRLAAGELPRIDRLRSSLERLSGSESTAHARYGERQLSLLRRIEAAGSREHGGLAGEPSGIKLG